MDDTSHSKSPPSSSRFSVLTNPVRAFGERASVRALSRRAANKQKDVTTAKVDASASTPTSSFVTSDVVSAFHLQHVHLPDGVERTAHGVATSGKVAIVAAVFALISFVGSGFWTAPAGADNAPSRSTTTHSERSLASAVETQTPTAAAVEVSSSAVEMQRVLPLEAATTNGVVAPVDDAVAAVDDAVYRQGQVANVAARTARATQIRARGAFPANPPRTSSSGFVELTSLQPQNGDATSSAAASSAAVTSSAVTSAGVTSAAGENVPVTSPAATAIRFAPASVASSPPTFQSVHPTPERTLPSVPRVRPER